MKDNYLQDGGFDEIFYQKRALAISEPPFEMYIEICEKQNNSNKKDLIEKFDF